MRLVLDGREIIGIAGVGELIEVDDTDAFGDNHANERGADKTRAAGNE